MPNERWNNEDVEEVLNGASREDLAGLLRKLVAAGHTEFFSEDLFVIQNEIRTRAETQISSTVDEMRPSRLLVKKKGQPHFVKDFGEGTTSERLMLPERDGSRVKITRFLPKDSAVFDGIVYSTDETVYLVSGRLMLRFADNTTTELEAGDVYYVPAGVSYGVTVLDDSEAICVFSKAGDGPMPDSE